MPFLEDISVLQMSCRKQNNSLTEKTRKISGLFSPDMRVGYAAKKGVPAHLRKASLTVEAALIIPMFFMAVICIAGIMGIYSRTLEEMVSLRDKAELAAEAVLSSDGESWIEIPKTVEFRPPFLPNGISAANVRCVGSARAWNGRDESGLEKFGGASSKYVYVTEHGKVYHTSSACTHIKLSISTAKGSELANIRNESGSRYKPCEKCADGSASDTVFITEYGDRYHNEASCSGLKRTVKLVDISKISGITECSKCMSGV